jgi:hypothetical protein
VARRPSARVVLNRQQVDHVKLAIADGLFEVGQQIIEVAAANAPDSPYDPYPLGEGLVKQGGVLAYVDGKKVAGWSQRGTQPKKPRALRSSRKAVQVAAGYGFPGLFVELGTVRSRAQPFLTPAMNQVAPQIPLIMERVVRPKLGGPG